jgi:hypothetical protein
MKTFTAIGMPPELTRLKTSIRMPLRKVRSRSRTVGDGVIGGVMGTA